MQAMRHLLERRSRGKRIPTYTTRVLNCSEVSSLASPATPQLLRAKSDREPLAACQREKCSARQRDMVETSFARSTR